MTSDDRREDALVLIGLALEAAPPGQPFRARIDPAKILARPADSASREGFTYALEMAWLTGEGYVTQGGVTQHALWLQEEAG